jgi:hypothetical protein
MPKHSCLACGQDFEPRSQSPRQKYCSEMTCQRERRRRWQFIKRHTDPDYKDNQSRAQQAWANANPNYWRDYRTAHPNYTESNRLKQRSRNQSLTSRTFAKMDASSKPLSPQSGLYLLIDETSGGVVKKDAWLVRLTLISTCKVERNS